MEDANVSIVENCRRAGKVSSREVQQMVAIQTNENTKPKLAQVLETGNINH